MVLSVLYHVNEQTCLFLSPQGRVTPQQTGSTSVLTGIRICNLKQLCTDAMKGLSIDAWAAPGEEASTHAMTVLAVTGDLGPQSHQGSP